MRVGVRALSFIALSSLLACRAEKREPAVEPATAPEAPRSPAFDFDRGPSATAAPAPTAAERPPPPQPESAAGEHAKKGECAPGDPLCDGWSGPSPDKNRKRGPMLASTKSLTDEMTSAELEDVIDANLTRFVACTKVDSVVTVHATIAPDGRVLEAASSAADPDDSFTRDCVAKAFSGLAFPKSKRARPTPVTFELALKPTSM